MYENYRSINGFGFIFNMISPSTNKQTKTIKLQLILEQILNFVVVFSLKNMCVYVLWSSLFKSFLK